MKVHVPGKLLLVLTATFIFFISIVRDVGAVEYLGEYCWNFTFNEDATGQITPVSGIGRYAITHTGETNYLLQWKGMIGSAMIDGNYLIVTTSSTSESEQPINHQAWTAHWKLDIASMSGTIWRTVTKFDTTNRTITHGYQAGTATFVACP